MPQDLGYKPQQTATDLMAEVEALRARAQRAEAALAEMQMRRPLPIAEKVPAMIYRRVLYPDGHIVYTHSSGGLNAMLGIAHEELLNDFGYIIDFVHPDDRQRFKDAILTSARTLEPMDIEQRYVKRSGEVVWCRSISQPTRRADGAVVFDGIAIDISDQKRAEAALRESERRMSLVTENVPASIYQRIMHPDGRLAFTFLSGGLHAMVGIETAALMQDAETLFDIIHPEDREPFKATLLASARSLEPMDVELRNIAPSGDVLWCRTMARPSRRPDGAVVWDGVTIDITDQKRAEFALRESEERFRGLVEASFDAIWIIEGGIITSVNGRAAELFGYDRTELIGRIACSLATEQSRKVIKQRVEGGSEGSFEAAIFHKNGHVVPVDVTFKHFGFGDRKVRIVAMRDCEERKRAEAALRESEERYRRLVEVSPYGIFVHADGGILFANDAAARMFGATSPGALASVPVLSLVHPDERNEVRRRLKQALRETRALPFAERRCLRIDGSEFTADSAAIKIAWKGGPAVLGVVSDATERKRAEDALRDSEERYRRVIEVSPLAILVHDGDLVLFANEAAATLFGAGTANDLVDTRWSDLIHPDEMEAARERTRLALAGHVALPFTQRRRRRLDGSEFIAESGITSINWNGRPAILGVIRDATERTRAEAARKEAAEIQARQLAELRQTKKRLETQSADLRRTAADLRRLSVSADRANATKSKFLATASHELRQPLQALNLLTYSLSTTARDGQTRMVVNEMRRALSATERLLNALLDINRLEAGVLTPEITSFSLVDLFERLRIELEGPSREKRLGFRVIPSRATVRSDFELLASIVRNFLQNAVKYTRAGRIVLGARRRGSKIRIEVWDTGIGIPEDQFTRIFDEFYQVGASGRHNEGLGLGLTIVERTAELLHHPINVRSVLGRGSVFSVTVPLAKGRRARRPAKPSPTRVIPKGRSALVIDDHVDVLAAMQRLLVEWGLEVEATDDVEAALARLRAGGRTPDVLIVDHRLPGPLTGITLLDEVRRIVGRSVPALVVTGDTSASQVRAIEAAGIPYLHKPIDPEKLRAGIAHLLHSADA
jgi:PAS domain S-box-containing protein